MHLFKTFVAWLYDEKGEYHGSKGFRKHSKTFEYGNGAYNVDFENSSYKESYPIPFLIRKRVYFYNIAYSNPIKLINGHARNMITPELYNINLKTKVARDLNDLSKPKLLDYLTPQNIIFMLIALGIGAYVLTGGKFLTG